MQLAFRTLRRHFWMRIASVKSPFLVLTHQSSQPSETIFFLQGSWGRTQHLPPVEGYSGLSSEELTVGSLCKHHTQHPGFKTCCKGRNEGRSSSPSLPLIIIFFSCSLALYYLFPSGRGMCERELGAIARLQRGDSLTSGGSKQGEGC